MHGSERSAQTVRFGIFEVDLRTGELSKNGIKVPLRGQLFQVCSLLLEHAGELVTREELRQRVRPQDTFVDFEQALNTAIVKIRLAPGDEADNPRLVQTLPRSGYRFIGPVAKPHLQAVTPVTRNGWFERSPAGRKCA
jgi:DNA-binding winged helix-turn-helix (wHTH) protein